MVTNGITYGASQLTSDGVSYTKNGETITVKKALDELITKSSKVDELEEHTKLYKYAYLADVAKEGDYVAYDTGTWSTSKEKPTENGNFGGYTKDQSKGESVSACSNIASHGSTTLKGWRVLKVEPSTKTVTIVHAGQPECYYHDGLSSTSINNLDTRSSSEYLNQTYATSAHAMKREDAEIIDQNSTLRKTGATYWLANEVSSYGLLMGYSTGQISGDNRMVALGYRPVVVLKSKILTTGKGQDQVGNNDAWQLVKP